MSRLPVKAYKCVVELNINEVSAPGVRLAHKEDLYLNVCMLGQQRRTRLVPPIFPLKFVDHLIFEKTFKFCRDPTDVINFLEDLHVLIELIQLGRTENNEVLATFETNAKEFLYPTSDIKPTYHSGQRDVFMARNEGFPGSISPQILFFTSTRIDETQTPSLDILKEYENRFVYDPLMEMKKKAARKKSKRNSLNYSVDGRLMSPNRGILRNYKNGSPENFKVHTISSAIKADYTLPDVKFKLDELNKSVKKTRIFKTARSAYILKEDSFKNNKPFVVRHVKDDLILRKPEMHDVLHDGLVLVRKNPNRIRLKKHKSRSKLRSRSLNQSQIFDRDKSFDRVNSSTFFQNENSNKDNSFAKRLSRSLSGSPHSEHRLGISLNKNLNKVNSRSRNQSYSRSASRSPSRNQNITYDILPDPNASFVLNTSSNQLNKKFDTTYENCNLCSNTHSNCEVCEDFRYRTHHNFRGHRFHRDESNLNKSNSSAIFHQINQNTRDPLNETQLFNSDDLAKIAFQNNYGTRSFKEANEISKKKLNNSKKKSKKYPKNQSFSNYAPPSNKLDWSYNRYYPWLFNYTEYLRELEDELYWLKVRSKYLNQN